MSVRFLADEDLRSAIVDGLRFREPAADILDVKTTAGLRSISDPDLLELASREERILITHDSRTMPNHVRNRIEEGKSTAGVFIASQRESEIGEVIESLLLVWTASNGEEWRNRIVRLPFR